MVLAIWTGMDANEKPAAKETEIAYKTFDRTNHVVTKRKVVPTKRLAATLAKLRDGDAFDIVTRNVE
jgi:hypothetical protein